MAADDYTEKQREVIEAARRWEEDMAVHRMELQNMAAHKIEMQTAEQKQKFILYGVDMLLEAFNKYPDSKSFTVKEIIKISNDVCCNIKENKFSEDDVAAEKEEKAIRCNICNNT